MRNVKRSEIVVIIGRISTGLIAIFLPPSDEILSFNVVWLFMHWCICFLLRVNWNITQEEKAFHG